MLSWSYACNAEPGNGARSELPDSDEQTLRTGSDAGGQTICTTSDADEQTICPIADPRAKIEAACRDGDISTLRKLFSELGIGPNHPFGNRARIPEHLQSVGTIDSFLWTVCKEGSGETIDFLCSYFNHCKPDLWCARTALESHNVGALKEIFRRNPGLSNEELYYGSILAAACQTKDPEIVKVLLDAGADTNSPHEHLFYRDDAQVVIGGLPASTMEQFFDAGYEMALGGPTMAHAIGERRVDIVEVLYRRGRELPDLILPSAKQLMATAQRTKNPELANLARRLFPEDFPERKGILATLLKKLH